jgi:RNA polymerase sigma factor for flagellar operon FliA
VDLEEYHRWLVEVQGLNIGSLEYTGEGRRRQGPARIPERRPGPTAFARAGALAARTTAVRRHPENPPMERTVLGLYYIKELTLREIAQVVDLHESRISHLKSQAILRLRANIEKVWPNQAGGVM